jgi:hypothetical protein
MGRFSGRLLQTVGWGVGIGLMGEERDCTFAMPIRAWPLATAEGEVNGPIGRWEAKH